jgi:peptide/nickel transport system ATP-binding protein
MTEPDGGPILRTEGLRKVYGDTVAVDDVSFDIAPGGSLAIVGESGSGKTTIARMIVGLTKPTAGTITACGRDRSVPARSAGERRRRGAEIQIVFQDPYSSLNPRQTAQHTLDEILRLHGTGRSTEERRARIATLGELVGLDERTLRALPGALSGGQRQRIAIARALLADPRVLILDDATSSVDASTEQSIKLALREVMAGRTTFVIAHRLSTIALADDIVVLEGGTIAARGTHGQLIDRSPLYAEIAEKGLPDQVFLNRNPRERTAEL